MFGRPKKFLQFLLSETRELPSPTPLHARLFSSIPLRQQRLRPAHSLAHTRTHQRIGRTEACTHRPPRYAQLSNFVP